MTIGTDLSYTSGDIRGVGEIGTPHRARLDAPKTLHHVIVRGIEKRKIIDDVASRENFVQHLGELAAATKTEVYT